MNTLHPLFKRPTPAKQVAEPVPDELLPYLADIARALGYTPDTLPLQINLEHATVLGVSKHTLNLWRSTGRYDLKFLKIGRCVRYATRDIAIFIKSNTFQHTGCIGGEA